MFEPVVEGLYQLFGSLTFYVDDHPKAFFSSCAVLIALLAYIPTILQDYWTYMDYGENGVPLTIRGWLLSTVFLRSLSSSDLLSTDMYKRNNDRRTWLDDDWPRKPRESRPIMGSHPAPQRQLNQIPTEAAKTELKRQFYALAKRNPKIVQLKPSFFEKQTESMFVSDGIPASQIAEDTMREISHIHATGDHSLHVTLAPQDYTKTGSQANPDFPGKKVIESGWGLRHPLDGAKTLKYMLGGMISQQYLLIYAPRNAEEIEIVIKVVKAAIGYMSESREVN
ncbi:hypothetical protein MMC29_003662 [Sticta canariensis]|nr:hypothetical protein [Sticta canariensis]